jgi:integrase
MATDIIVTLSLTGLRQGEARALRWSDWNEREETLMISRAIWHTHLGGTKNPSSENVIPVLPLLADLLRNRQARINPKEHDFIFAGKRRKAALNFHNVETQIIKPTLKNSAVQWKGFHGFRRGLATNLLELGINPMTIARILRHSDVTTTLAFYAKSRDAESRIAMDKLEEKIRNRKSGVLIGGKEAGQNSSR